MATKVTRKELEKALETYANLVEMYPDNEAYLQRYADMLQAMGREATATITLQHLHDIIAKRSPDEAKAFAKKYPQIGRILLDDIAFEDHDKHAISGQIIAEVLGKLWLKLHSKTLKEGQAICHVDDLQDSLILLTDGSADAFAVDKQGNRVLVEHINAIDVLGEHTFFRPNKMNIDVFVASDTATVAHVPRKKLAKMVADNPHLEKMLKLRAVFRTHVHALARNEVFQTMPLKLTKYLARKLMMRQYEAGSMIYTLDQPVHGIDIILSGEVCYLAQNRQKEKVMLSPLPLLSIAGDTSLKGGETTGMAELVAKTKATLAHINYEDLLNVSMAYAPLKDKLMQHADMQKVNMMREISKL